MEDAKEKILFIPFKGVGPHRFIDLFSMQSTRWYARTRKDDEGNIIPWKRNEANLRNPMSVFSYIEMEKAAYKQYNDEIVGIREEEEYEQYSNKETKS